MAVEPQGLTTAHASAVLTTDGPNVIPQPRRRSLPRRFLDQFIHFFALLLWGAAVLAAIARLPQVSIAIVSVIIVNALFAFIQESRADRAADRLTALLPTLVTVIRDGRRTTVDASHVVRGDLICLESGDRVPADARVVRANILRLDASMMTGESVPVDVGVGEIVFAGTFVVEGEADALVEKTGSSTRIADIAQMSTAASSRVTPLALELRRVVRLIAVIAISVGALFFVITLLLGNAPAQGLIFGIGVTVALVPEALLPTVTLTLAWGAEHMANRHVLVRDLEAVETLGSTTIICTDKTGTLTRNEMTVLSAWTPQGSATATEPGYQPEALVTYGSTSDHAAIRELARVAQACSDGYVYEHEDKWLAHGDPMEAALDAFAQRVDPALVMSDVVATLKFPFDPRRRRMSVVRDGHVLVKGAPDSVLPLCSEVGDAQDAAALLAANGLRVLAVATRSLVDGDLPRSPNAAETDLTLVGLIGLEDPPRSDVRTSIEQCRTAGIAVIMITGDHPETARAVADQVGLRGPEGVVIVGDELPKDDEALGALVEQHGTVVARVAPEDKLRIARVLRERGHVVAMTGDGVNDVPALEAADLGIAMGASGTDVAREAADLVLLDDHFASIVAGIEQGRATFLNTRKFLTYHLTDNVAELAPFVVWAVSGGSIPLALGVLQILALDIGTDTMSAVALGAEPPGRHVLTSPPVSGRLLNRTVLRRAFGLLGPTMAAMSMAAFFVSFIAAGWRPGDEFPTGSTALAASGAAFMAVIFGQAANGFACRSSIMRPGQLGWFTNRLLLPAVALAIAVSLALLLIPSVADFIGQEAPPLAGWLVAMSTAIVILGVDAIDKARRARVDQR